MPTLLQVLHWHHLQLLGLGSVGQYALQKLLVVLTFQSNIPTSFDPKKALSELFIAKKTLLNGMSTLFQSPVNADIIYSDVKNEVIRRSIDFGQLDTSALVDILQNIDAFPTCKGNFRKSFQCCGTNHRIKCCLDCNHVCQGKCKKQRCKDGCCMTKASCNHECITCGETHFSCTNNRRVCCLHCKTCLNCMISVISGCSDWLMLWNMLCDGLVQVCTEQQLKLSVFIMVIFRNMTMHITFEECELMDKGLFNCKEIPHCSDWKTIWTLYYHAVDYILRYVKTNHGMSLLEYNMKEEEIREVRNFSKTDLLASYSSELKAYKVLESINTIHTDIKQLKKTTTSIQGTLNDLSLRRLILSFYLVVPRDLSRDNHQPHFHLKSQYAKDMKSIVNNIFTAHFVFCCSPSSLHHPPSFSTCVTEHYHINVVKFKEKNEILKFGQDKRVINVKIVVVARKSTFPILHYADSATPQSEELWDKLLGAVKIHFGKEETNVFLFEWDLV